jgi:hypothetical protein
MLQATGLTASAKKLGEPSTSSFAGYSDAKIKSKMKRMSLASPLDYLLDVQES